MTFVTPFKSKIRLRPDCLWLNIFFIMNTQTTHNFLQMLRSSLINFFHQTVLLVQNSGYFGSLISSKKGDASSQWLSGPMFELRMGQYRLYRDDRHRENAPHFIVFSLNNLGHYWGPIKIARVHAGTFMRDSFEIGLFPPYSSCHFRVKISPNPHSMGHMFFGLQWSLETIS